MILYTSIMVDFKCKSLFKFTLKVMLITLFVPKWIVIKLGSFSRISLISSFISSIMVPLKYLNLTSCFWVFEISSLIPEITLIAYNRDFSFYFLFTSFTILIFWTGLTILKQKLLSFLNGLFSLSTCCSRHFLCSINFIWLLIHISHHWFDKDSKLLQTLFSIVVYVSVVQVSGVILLVEQFIQSSAVGTGWSKSYVNLKKKIVYILKMEILLNWIWNKKSLHSENETAISI